MNKLNDLPQNVAAVDAFRRATVSCPDALAVGFLWADALGHPSSGALLENQVAFEVAVYWAERRHWQWVVVVVVVHHWTCLVVVDGWDPSVVV